MTFQTYLPEITPNTPIVDRNLNVTKRFLIGGEDALLSWDGERLKLALGSTPNSPNNTVLFNVTPKEITKVHLYQRISMKFFINGQKYMVYYPKLSFRQTVAGVAGSTVPPISTGSALVEMRDVVLQSPMNVWLKLYKQLGIKVWDDTFTPPTRGQIVGWTFAIFIGALVLASFVGFTTHVVFGGW